jgi:pSer/pThr/pTyr-binding forkhead associated (FHA) protein
MEVGMSSTLWSCGYQVRISDGPDRGRTFALDAVEVTIGRTRHQGDRAPGWILLNDAKVSRIHVDLRWVEDQKTYLMSHRSDTNQTLLNGQPVPPNVETALTVGDLIRIGDTELDLQQADFRFGGVDPLQASLMANRSRTGGGPNIPVLSARDSKLDNEKSMSTKRAGRKAALTLRPDFLLEVVMGRDKGLVVPISGMRVALGGPRLIEDAPPPKDRNWDQEAVLTDEGMPENYLLLAWRELSNAFELRRRDGQPALNVYLERNADGVIWRGELPPNESAMLRDGDAIFCANSTLLLYIPAEEE